MTDERTDGRHKRVSVAHAESADFVNSFYVCKSFNVIANSVDPIRHPILSHQIGSKWFANIPFLGHYALLGEPKKYHAKP